MDLQPTFGILLEIRRLVPCLLTYLSVHAPVRHAKGFLPSHEVVSIGSVSLTTDWYT